MSADNQNQDKRPNSLYIIEVERAHERQPFFKGKINVDGKELDIALWEKPPRDGKKFYTGQVSDPAEYKNRQANAGSGNAGKASSPAAAPTERQSSPPSTAPKNGENQAFDDIFGSEGDQW